MGESLDTAASPSPAPRPPPGPTPASERVVALDVLRGLALLGVAVVNALVVSGPLEWTFSRPFAESPEPWISRAIALLFEAKAYSLLAFLFGAGFALQAERLETAGAPVARTLVRRQLGLAAIGLAHAVLVWSGDILLAYGLVGLLLLVFRRRRPGTILAWAIALVAVNALLLGAAAGAIALLSHAAPDRYAALVRTMADDDARNVAAAFAAYGAGTWGAALARRLHELLPMHASTLTVGPQMLGVFLAGVWAVRRGLVREPEARAGFLRRAALLLGGAGFAGEIAYVRLVEGGTRDFPSYLAGQAVHLLAATALALGAAAAVVLALGTGRGRRALAPLAPLGRMALTSYVVQSVVFTAIFYRFGDGPGLFGRVPPGSVVTVAITTWLAQALLAQLWLARFDKGPLEALWRRITYGRLARALPAAAGPATDGTR
jgi:uncharacterized protein